MTLREAGCDTVAMTSQYQRPESYAASRIGRALLNGPALPRTRLVRINGKNRVTSLVLEHVDSHGRRTVERDTVVTTGGWTPDHEFARTG